MNWIVAAAAVAEELRNVSGEQPSVGRLQRRRSQGRLAPLAAHQRRQQGVADGSRLQQLVPACAVQRHQLSFTAVGQLISSFYHHFIFYYFIVILFAIIILRTGTSL